MCLLVYQSGLVCPTRVRRRKDIRKRKKILTWPGVMRFMSYKTSFKGMFPHMIGICDMCATR